MHTKPQVVALLRARGLRLSKRLGQSYLIDPHLAERLVGLCDLSANDTVVEIGAGLGALTGLLAGRVRRVVAVEIDKGVAEALRACAVSWPGVEVHREDILKFDWDPFESARVVGAVPYHITSPILVRLCEQSRRIRSAHLAVQREVAERLAAKPGSKSYGRLAILVQYHFDVKKLAELPRAVFFPQPTVDSRWIGLIPRSARPLDAALEAKLFELVHDAFGQRRKMLTGSLKGRPGLARALAEMGLRADVRPEQLSVGQFAELTKRLAIAEGAH